MILIIGGLGNMGQRYSKILEKLEIPFEILDLLNLDSTDSLIKSAKKVIIATPSNLHFDYLIKVLDANKQVLCEKPITKNLDELSTILRHENINQLSMVNNYFYAYNRAKRLQEVPDTNETTYDFIYSGADGIGWDCIQLIYLSRGIINLANKSQKWSASINGYNLNYHEVIKGYELMLKDFIDYKESNIDLMQLKLSHECAHRINEAYENEKSCYRHTATSKID